MLTNGLVAVKLVVSRAKGDEPVGASLRGRWERRHPCLHGIAREGSRQGCLRSQEQPSRGDTIL
jgi:hypothetical protein